MRCPRCQHDNRPGARFCEECATALQRACAACGAPLSATAKFCPECAHPTAAPPARQFVSPQVYTPKHLAERILTSKAAIEGERKHVTILFADLKGSLELLADRDPEEARKLLDPVLERMIDAVHRYEGTVNQVMGDGIMALFGAPIAQEDHAARAPAMRRCACRMPWGDTPRSCAVRRASMCRSASASTPVTSSCARSAAICTWTTPRSVKRRTSPRGWSSWRDPARRC